MFDSCSSVPFKNLVKFMQKCSEVPSKNKETQFKAFLQYCVPRPSPDIFQIFRLLLPAEDAERVRYGLKEDKLAALLVKAAGLNEDSTNAKAAKNWKKGHVQNAGIFPEVMEQYVLRSACVAAANAESTTVADVNTLLDRLAAAADFKQQIPVMRDVYQQCSAAQVKWLLRIILKDLKIGMSKERMLRLFHPDAIDMLNITNSLQQVCEELASPTHRMARKDIMPGCAIKMQLCLRANSLEEVFTRMKGKPFTTEVKLDGYRMQVHVTHQEVMYFSRRGREHGRLSNYTVFDKVVREQVKLHEPDDAVIIDGEVVVWNKTRGVFEAFGGVRSAMNAAREQLPPDHVLGTKFEEGQLEDEITAIAAQEGSLKQQQEGEPAEDIAATVGDVELVYFAFDILYVGKESVINRPLHERHQLLQSAIRCISADQPGTPCNDSSIGGRVVALLPDQPLPLPVVGAAVEQRQEGGAAVPCAAVLDLVLSRTGKSLDDVQRMYDVAISRQDEGIVVKQLESCWKPDDRSGVWLKMKPDYTEQAEIDAVIIAAYYGAGRRGGQISEFLLGLTEPGAGGVWASFCKVATGIKDIERQQLWDRLAPLLVRHTQGLKPPRCYRLSGKEDRPDFWVSDPRRSVVLEVKSDVRTIISKTFAIPYSLRFPRVTKICWDRAGDDIASCLDVERLVADNKGRLTDRQMGVGAAGVQGVGGRRPAQRKAGTGRTQRSAVVGVAQLPDVSAVQEQSAALAGKEVCVLTYCHDTASKAELDAAKQEIGAMIKRNGGKQVVSPRPQTDHVLAAFLSASRARTLRSIESSSSTNAQRAYDVVLLDWLREVDQAKLLLPIMPRHRLYLTSATRLALAAAGAGEHDIYGNPFLLELQAEDVAALVQKLIPDSELAKFQGRLLKGEEQLQQQLERSATLELAASEQQGAATDDDTTSSSSSTTLETPRSVVHGVQQQLHLEAEWSDSSTTLFAQCCLLFVPYIPEPQSLNHPTSVTRVQGAGFNDNGEVALGCANPAAVQLGAGNTTLAIGSTALGHSAGSTDEVVLLDCAVEGCAVATAWRMRLAQQVLADVKLAVMLHGGSVAETYGPLVSHIVLWPVGVQHEQQLQQWLVQAESSSSSSKNVQAPGALIWPLDLLPGQQKQQQQQQQHLSAQQLLWQLAAVAEAAVEGAAAAAAAAAAAQAQPVGRKSQPRFSRLRPVSPPAPASRTGSGSAFGLLGFGIQEARGSVLGSGSQGYASTQAKHLGFGQLGLNASGYHQAATTAAIGARHMKVEQGINSQQEAAAAAAATATIPPQLSPAGLKQLRLIRRRLVAAQRNDARLAGTPPTHPVNASSAASESKRKSSITNAPAVLHLVAAGWVIDSLMDLKQQQQQQQQYGLGGRGLVQHRSEALYEPTVLVQQQQQVELKEKEEDGSTAAAAAAGGAGGGAAEKLDLMPAADVRKWPWHVLGLSVAGGAGSSSGSSGHSTDDQRNKLPAKQPRKRGSKSTTGSRRKRQDTPTVAAAAAPTAGGEDEHPPLAKRCRRTAKPNAAAAAEVEEASTEGDSRAAPAKKRKTKSRQKTQQGQQAAATGTALAKGSARDRGSRRGSHRAGRGEDQDDWDTEDEMSDHVSSQEESDHDSLSVSEEWSNQGERLPSTDNEDTLQHADDFAQGSSAAEIAGAAGPKVARQNQRRQHKGQRRLQGTAAAAAAAAAEAAEGVNHDKEQPPGWLGTHDSQQQQQQPQEEASQQVQADATTEAVVPKWRLLASITNQEVAAAVAPPPPAAAAAVVAGPSSRRSGLSLASMFFADDSQWQGPAAAAPPPAGVLPDTIPESVPSGSLNDAEGVTGTIGTGAAMAATMAQPAPAAAGAAATSPPKRGGNLLSRWLDDDDDDDDDDTTAAATSAPAPAPPAVQAVGTHNTVPAVSQMGIMHCKLAEVPQTAVADQFDQQQAVVGHTKDHQPGQQSTDDLNVLAAAMPAAAAAGKQAPQTQAPKRSLAALRAKYNL